MPKNLIRSKCYEMANGSGLEIIDVIMSIIGAAFYCSIYYLMPNNLYWIFISIVYFTFFELNVYFLIKLIGLASYYMQNKAHYIDIIVLICCDIGMILDLANLTHILFAIGIALHLAKNLRWLTLIKDDKIRVIIDSLAFILPSLLNVCILLLIILVIYAVLGLQLFWNVKYHGTLNDTINFRSFGKALLLTLTCATGNDWNDIMYDLTFVEGECTSEFQDYAGLENNGVIGCGTYMTYPYFITFVILVQLIGIKLLNVVVLEGYMDSANENYSLITAKDFDKFVEKWTIYDPQGTGWISVEGLVYLLFSLDPPLGVYTKQLRDNMWNTYKNTNRVSALRNRSIKTLIEKVDVNEEFILHKYEYSVFERRKVMKLLLELKIPLETGTWRVHYRDVCKRLAIRAIRAKKDANFE